MSEGSLANYNKDINEFQKEQQVLMDHLKNFKVHIK